MKQNKILKQYIKQVVTMALKGLVGDVYSKIAKLEKRIDDLEMENGMLGEMLEGSNGNDSLSIDVDEYSKKNEQVEPKQNNSQRSDVPPKQNLAQEYFKKAGIDMSDIGGDVDYEVDENGVPMLSEESDNLGPADEFLKKDYTKTMKEINVRGID